MIRVLGAGGFWRRGAAFGIDAMWLFCVAGTLSWLLLGIALPWGTALSARGLAAQSLHELLPALVCVIGWVRYGMTPGKLLLELRVIDAASGARPGWTRAIIRYLGYFVSALPLGLGFVWAAFDRDGRALHDRLAGTRVVRIEETVMADREVPA